MIMSVVEEAGRVRWVSLRIRWAVRMGLQCLAEKRHDSSAWIKGWGLAVVDTIVMIPTRMTVYRTESSMMMMMRPLTKWEPQVLLVVVAMVITLSWAIVVRILAGRRRCWSDEE
jgi:hypothetical protein